MKHESGDGPIAGRLSELEFRQHGASLLALFESAVVATEELLTDMLTACPGIRSG